MDNKLYEKLDDLNISDTNFLLEKDINLELDHLTIKRLEKSVMKKAGYYNSNNLFAETINNILGGIIMKRKIAIALAVVAVSSLGGGVYAHAKTTPVAYVSMDINPSIELGVNTFNEVVSAEAYNEDGKKVLEGTNLVNIKVKDAVDIVISNAVSDGYLKDDDTISKGVADPTATTSAAVEITTATDKDGLADKLNESLKEAADKALEDNSIEATVETDNVALARRDEARQLGITPGKLNLIQKLQALDTSINVEDYKDSSVKDIQKKFQELKKENKSNDAVNTDTNTDTNSSANTDTNVNTDVIAKESTNNSSNGNGTVKKEEHSNSNSKKEDNVTAGDKEKDTADKSEKQNNNSNSNSQNKGNSAGKNKNN
ncbi:MULTISPECIES: hypothetical protein [unclassified Clostridium]|uniref:anti-sigma-I factor RsgI family protein n=1 Tax=unclassified Clostridium TaxID=2614128 RepID=UPI0002975C37|nr:MULTISPECIES: hypothetical protein [unclassified Clostridium]EKQ53288.1 MAG: hypothetical protein A370_03805 [Clostridium sp. Maddingley MBC34-26]